MSDRLEYLACYVGSAAVVAFLAACLDAPRVDTFMCETPAGETTAYCVPVQDAATAPDADPFSVALAP